MADKQAVLGNGAKFTGKISNSKSIEINGVVQADLVTEKVTIGSTGNFKGAVKSDLVVIAGEYEGSLLSSINFCRTAMGRRLLKTWILRPLSNIDAITSRQNSVNALFRSSKRIDSLRESLKGLRDVERLATQLAYNRSNARDLLATSIALERMPSIVGICQQTDDILLNHLISNLDSLPIYDRSLVNYEDYHKHIGHAGVKHSVAVQATRGCPYRCFYCDVYKTTLHHFRRSVDSIYDWIEISDDELVPVTAEEIERAYNDLC